LLASAIRKRGGRCDPLFWSGTFGGHLFYTNDIIVYLLEGHSDVLYRNVAVKMPDNGFNRIFHLCVKYKAIFLSEGFLYGIVVNHTFGCDPEEYLAHDTF
jgi:hypothetical protein